MKKSIPAILFSLIACFALLAGCGAEITLFDVCGDEVAAWAEGYDAEAPDALTVYVVRDGYDMEPQSVTDPEIINEVFSALGSIRVKGAPDKGPIDFTAAPTEVTYCFRADDGGEVSFTFLDRQFALGDPIGSDGLLYSCSGSDLLLSIEGIELSRLERADAHENDFFAFFEDDAVSAFAEDFYTDKPVSVAYTFNGEASGVPVVSTDPDDIAAVFEAMAAISVSGKAELRSADNEHVFEFTSLDGSSVVFYFNGHALEYGGEVYTIERDDGLWELTRRIFG